LGAGVGSAASEPLGIRPGRLWALPFIAVIALCVLVQLVFPSVARAALQLPIAGRMLVSGLMLFPVGFFLGMPFPLGVLAIAGRPRGAVAWAWGMNGLFTVVGGLLSMLLSLRYGFNFALSFALCLYGVAFIVYRPLRDAKMEEAPISDQAGLASPSRPAL
jgi:hypothetical protein